LDTVDLSTTTVLNFSELMIDNLSLHKLIKILSSSEYYAQLVANVETLLFDGASLECGSGNAFEKLLKMFPQLKRVDYFRPKVNFTVVVEAFSRVPTLKTIRLQQMQLGFDTHKKFYEEWFNRAKEHLTEFAVINCGFRDSTFSI